MDSKQLGSTLGSKPRVNPSTCSSDWQAAPTTFAMNHRRPKRMQKERARGVHQRSEQNGCSTVQHHYCTLHSIGTPLIDEPATTRKNQPIKQPDKANNWTGICSHCLQNTTTHPNQQIQTRPQPVEINRWRGDSTCRFRRVGLHRHPSKPAGPRQKRTCIKLSTTTRRNQQVGVRGQT